MTSSEHELHDYLARAAQEMASTYTTIRRRSKEDPGTAGDQGEEDWANLLRGWLPPQYHIVTKGRIISRVRDASPQVDILVLHPAYPRILQKEKYYLAEGVLAAFECKTTYRRRELKKFFVNSAAVKNKSAPQYGSLASELLSQITYGMLAHSSDFEDEPWTASSKLGSLLLDQQRSGVADHPILLPDVVCIADLTCFHLGILVQHPIRGYATDANGTELPLLNSDTISTSYYSTTMPSNRASTGGQGYNPIAVLLSYLLKRLAWQDVQLRSIASYFGNVAMPRAYTGLSCDWPITMLSQKCLAAYSEHRQPGLSTLAWDDWQNFLP